MHEKTIFAMEFHTDNFDLFSEKSKHSEIKLLLQSAKSKYSKIDFFFCVVSYHPKLLYKILN